MAKPSSLDTYKNLIQQLKSGKVQPVYFLCGQETFFLDRIQDQFTDMVPKESRDFNIDILYGQDATLDQVLSISKSYPMMAEKRMVVVRDFSRLFDTKEVDDEENTARNAGPDDLLAYIKNPNPTNMLILIDEKAPSGNTRLGKGLKKGENVGYHEFPFVPEHQLPGWISGWVKHTHNGNIEPDASQLLASHLGHNLLQLTVEIEKLATYKKQGEAINQEDVRSIVGLSREFTIFELQDAVTARDMENALYIAEQILRLADSIPGEVIKTIGFFYSMFSNVWQIQRFRAKNCPDKQIMKEIGVGSSFYFNKLSDISKSYHYQETLGIFEALLDADKAVKGFSKLDHEAILLMTIKKIVGKN
ncbi:MAG: DNA polymerase III subunit delta [Balneolales bacterium]